MSMACPLSRNLSGRRSIDHYGERLVGCIECNRWSWRRRGKLSRKSKDYTEEVEPLIDPDAAPVLSWFHGTLATTDGSTTLTKALPWPGIASVRARPNI